MVFAGVAYIYTTYDDGRDMIDCLSESEKRLGLILTKYVHV